MNFISQIKIFLSFPDNILIIQNGKIKTKKGKVTGYMLSDLSDIIQKNKIRHAYILYKKRAKKLILNGIPSHSEQQIRNIWNANYKKY